MRNNFPYIFGKLIIKEFSTSLAIFTLLIISLIILTNFVEELFFIKDSNFVKNFYLYSFFLTLIKSPSILIELFPFVFLFASIHYFVKIIRNNELLSLKISGISNYFVILIPSFFSFFLGIIIIFSLTPISSKLSQYYETEKKIVAGNNNLIIVNDTGIWIKEKNEKDEIYIFRGDNLAYIKGKIIIKNLSIFNLEKSGKLKETLIAEYSEVNNNFWKLTNVKKYYISLNKYENFKKIIFKTKINFQELNDIFSNTNTFSIWDINEFIYKLRSRGYYGDELVIKFHKYLSLPILLFATVIFSTIFTTNTKRRFGNYTYSLIGVVSGICIYFLSDLSIALGKSDRLPLVLSVWMPIILILILSLFSLTRSNEK